MWRWAGILLRHPANAMFRSSATLPSAPASSTVSTTKPPSPRPPSSLQPNGITNTSRASSRRPRPSMQQRMLQQAATPLPVVCNISGYLGGSRHHASIRGYRREFTNNGTFTDGCELIVITDPEDKRFDLEAYLNTLSK